MSSISLARVLACLALCAGTARAATPPPQDAADPRATVPPTVYRPAVPYRTAPPPTGTPDRNWIASNAAVTRQPGMSMPMSMPMQMPGHDAHVHDKPAADCANCAPVLKEPPMQPMHHMHHMDEMQPKQPAAGAAHQHGEAP